MKGDVDREMCDNHRIDSGLPSGNSNKKETGRQPAAVEESQPPAQPSPAQPNDLVVAAAGSSYQKLVILSELNVGKAD